MHANDSPDGFDFGQNLQRLDALVAQGERLGDPAARAHLREVVRSLLELHGAALARLLDHVAAAGLAGAAVLDACAGDDAVAGLLLLHGLHPLSAEQRVREALERVRPHLRSHGGSVELVEISDGVVRLRLEGSCDGCPSSAATMKQTIESAVFAAAPDVAGVEVEGAAELPAAAEGRGRVALPVL